MRSLTRHPMLLGLISGALLDLPFPIAGPLPPWRAIFAWVALVPLLYGLLAESSVAAPRYLRRSALAGYACGVLWYVLNCYWIYDTMYVYGHVPAPGAAGIVLLYSLVLGLYFALFGFLVALTRRAFQSFTAALLMAPFYWAALELAAAHITSVPWDQLGYSQVDNFLLTRLAPLTGVYGISFVLLAGNALLAAVLLIRSAPKRMRMGVLAIVLILLTSLGTFFKPKAAATTDYAVMLQPNLDVGGDNEWVGPEWNENISWILEQSKLTCTSGFHGVPVHGAIPETLPCDRNTPPPGIVAWPEAPSPFRGDDPRFITLLRTLAATAHAPVVVGHLGNDPGGTYNSGVFVAPDGTTLGRYDKIHLVPFGEYVPYRNLFFFAHQLTQRLADLSRGKERKVFHANGHAFGIFICYESIFADEIRQFALNGAQVFINIADDGWYGDTSAPWQHMNMTRMRAIENHRWILLDTNNGVTTALDPNGRVTFSAPRNVMTTLVARYGYNEGLTFYTRYGDVFAMLCGIIALAAVVQATRLIARQSSSKRQVS